MEASNKAALLNELAQGTIYLMGVSFILGSLFTILILLIFDFMQRQFRRRESENEE